MTAAHAERIARHALRRLAERHGVADETLPVRLARRIRRAMKPKYRRGRRQPGVIQVARTDGRGRSVWCVCDPMPGGGNAVYRVVYDAHRRCVVTFLPSAAARVSP